METEARVRGLAGWARGRALGDSVSARRFSGHELQSTGSGSRFTTHQPLLSTHAFLIASRQNIKNRANSLTTNEKTFLNR
jgi:hypothetical protein